MLLSPLLSLIFCFFLSIFCIKCIFNEIYDKLFNNKRRVRFTADEVKVYHLSKQERQMKKDAYKRINKESKHYRKMHQLCYLMEDLKI